MHLAAEWSCGRLQEEQLRAAKMEITKLSTAKESANAKLRIVGQQKSDADRARDDLKCVSCTQWQLHNVSLADSTLHSPAAGAIRSLYTAELANR